jgi:hypothetical protein
MNLKGWPFEPITGIDNQVCGDGASGGGSPG